MRGVPADKSAAMMAPKQKVEKPMRIMGRLFGYILRRYKLHCLGVLLFIFGSTAATVAGNLFMKTLIDDYIVPYIGEGGASDFGPLLAALLKMGCVFLFGVLCTLLYNRIMVYVSQGTMRAIRDDLFRHMERLPIRYFDTHAHGDIMSIYTNDIDTLRQMISQSFPQLLISAVTVITVFGIMLYYSIWLAAVVVLGVVCILFAFLYTTLLSYRGWGDVLVLVFFGFVPVCGTYYVQAYTLNMDVVVLSLVSGLAIDTLLMVNNYRDREQDAVSGKCTLVVRYGKKFGENMYLALGIAAVLLCFWFVYTGKLTPLEFIWAPCVYLYMHALTWRKMIQIGSGKKLNSILGETSRNMLFLGLLLAVALN